MQKLTRRARWPTGGAGTAAAASASQDASSPHNSSNARSRAFHSPPGGACASTTCTARRSREAALTRGGGGGADDAVADAAADAVADASAGAAAGVSCRLEKPAVSAAEVGEVLSIAEAGGEAAAAATGLSASKSSSYCSMGVAAQADFGQLGGAAAAGDGLTLATTDDGVTAAGAGDGVNARGEGEGGAGLTDDCAGTQLRRRCGRVLTSLAAGGGGGGGGDSSSSSCSRTGDPAAGLSGWPESGRAARFGGISASLDGLGAATSRSAGRLSPPIPTALRRRRDVCCFLNMDMSPLARSSPAFSFSEPLSITASGSSGMGPDERTATAEWRVA